MKYSDDFQPVVFENFKKELDNIEIDLSNARIRFTRNLQYQFGKIIPDLFNEYENDVKKIVEIRWPNKKNKTSFMESRLFFKNGNRWEQGKR